MAFALLIALLSTLGGSALTYLWENRATLGSRLAAGVCMGQTLLGLIAYPLALAVGDLRGIVLALATLITATPLILFVVSPECRTALMKDIRHALRPRLKVRQRWGLYLAVTALGGVLLLALYGAMYERGGEIKTFNQHNFGDLPLHLAIVQGFATGQNYPPEHPEFSGTRLTYPFLVDFVAAVFVRAGARPADAFFLQNALLALALLTLFLRFATMLTRSRTAAAVALTLILFGGGWGWLHFREAFLPENGYQGLRHLILHFPRDYSIALTGLRWGNPIITLLTTQRGLMLGIPLALLVWTLWWQAVRRGEAKDTFRRLLWAGALAGVTPLVHGHTFLMLLMVGAALALAHFLQDRTVWRGWAAFFVVSIVLAAPQMAYLAQSTAAKGSSFLGWQPGWDKGDANFFVFWYQNTGLFIPLMLVALFMWERQKGRLVWFSLPFALCFVVPNLVKLAPWVWDNIKVLYYWYMMSALLVGVLISWLWRRRGWGGRLVAVLLFLPLLLSGILDVWRVVSRQATLVVFGATDIAFAEKIQQNTSPRSVLLTAPAHNHPARLAGRNSVMGYPGHLWTHGLDFAPREADLKAMYAGAPDAVALLERYQVNYCVIGPFERGNNTLTINEDFWSHFPLVAAEGEYRLLQIRPQATPP